MRFCGVPDVILILMKKTPALISFFSSGRFFLPLFIVLSLFLLGQSFYKVRTRENQLDLLQSEVDALGAKAGEKLGELEYRRSSDFVYKEALERLGYTKPGERIVVLPDFEEERAKEGNSQSEESGGSVAGAAVKDRPLWKQWRSLFFEN